MKKILVTGAGGSPSYNFIESLRHNPENEKFYIVGTDISPYHIELSNIDKRYVIPRFDDPKYLEILNTIIKKEKIDFVHSQPDGEVYFIAKNNEKILTKTLFPDHKTIDICQDKMKFNKILKDNSLPVPEAYYIRNEKDLEEGLSEILKSNEKAWLRAIRGAGSKAALPIKNIYHAKAWIDYWCEMKGLSYDDFMISEFLPGKEYAFQSLWFNGELIASQARERVEYLFGHLMVSGQSSSPSVAVSVHNNEINETVYKVVKAIDPNASGIFCADLKTNKNGQIVLMEINAGRFFTTSYFFSAAGCNMPYYYVRLGIDGKVDIPYTKFNNIPAGWHWVRMMDMGYKLIKENEWTSQKIQ